MPLSLINPINSLERALTQQGLDTIDCGEADLRVYGGGEWIPGEAFDKLLEAKRLGAYLGVIGMTIPEDILASDIADDRMNLGHVLLRASKANDKGEWATYPAFVVDSISQGYAGHFAFNAGVGGHPAWLAEDVPAAQAWDEHTIQNVMVARGELGPAIAAALLQKPCILYIPVEDGGVHADRAERHPLMRFANDFGMRECVALSKNNLEMRLKCIEELPIVAPEHVEEAKLKARSTFQLLLPSKSASLIDVAGAIANMLGKTVEEEEDTYSWTNPKETPVDMNKRIQSPSDAPRIVSGFGPRELELGAVFDPAKHYDDAYFGEGRGLLYTDTDGSKKIYHGPGHRWGGFSTVAGILTHALPKKGRYLSLGCGTGDDMRYFKQQGWDVYGIDLSESAIAAGAQTAPDLVDRLVCADVLDKHAFEGMGGERFDLIASYDFWEHIWLKDIAALQQRVCELLKPGGVHFNIVCTRSKLEKDWTIMPGDCFTQENSWLLASGHVTIRPWEWWVRNFRTNGFIPRLDVAYVFQMERQEDAALKQAQSWEMRHTVVTGKSK